MEFSNPICCTYTLLGAIALSILRPSTIIYIQGPEIDLHVPELGFGHENISTAILRFSLIQEGQLSVNGRRMYTITISTGSKKQCG